MRVRVSVFILLMLANLNLIAATDTCQPELNTSNYFEVRLEIPGATDLSQLIGKPRKIVVDVGTVQLSGVQGKFTLTDFDAVYPVTLEKASKVLSDYANYHKIFPRFLEAGIICGKSDNTYYKVEQLVSAEFAGFGDRYDCIVNVVPVGEMLRGTFAIKWNLEEELDGKLYGIYGSWYLKEITLSGKKYIYVRQYLKNVYRKLPVNAEILRLVLPYEIKSVFDAFYKKSR